MLLIKSCYSYTLIALNIRSEGFIETERLVFQIVKLLILTK